MNSNELLRIVDAIHRDKNIDKEIVFLGLEAALLAAAKRHYGEEEEIQIQVDRQSGAISGTHNGAPVDPDEIFERIAAQTAKQVMIQKIREAERDTLFDEYSELKDQLVSGIVQRYEGATATVSLDRPGPVAEAILPRSEQIPGETHHNNERVRATVAEVRKQGSRVKIILSRSRAHLVARLFEQEIPEIGDGVIEIKALAREPGYRTKVAVVSTDQRVDCVGACVGVRGNRIKNIVDELGGTERIDIVRWSDDMQAFISNALQPAEVEEVILCQMLGKAIVLVHEDQLSLAIGRRGQNVRLASKLCGWDIDIMTREELEDALEKSVAGFSSLQGVAGELSDRLVGEGFLTYDELSVIEPEDLMEMGGLTREQADAIVTQAEEMAQQAEKALAAERRRQREQKALGEMAVPPAEEETAAVPAEEVALSAEGDTVSAEGDGMPVEGETEGTKDEPAEAEQPVDRAAAERGEGEAPMADAVAHGDQGNGPPADSEHAQGIG